MVELKQTGGIRHVFMCNGDYVNMLFFPFSFCGVRLIESKDIQYMNYHISHGGVETLTCRPINQEVSALYRYVSVK